MWVAKKEWIELQKRVAKLEANEQKVATAEHGVKSLRWYIRMLSANVKNDPRKELRSWGD